MSEPVGTVVASMQDSCEDDGPTGPDRFSPYEDIAEQLEDNCPCFADEDHEEVVSIAKSLIHMLSLATCWTVEACGTLLYEPRQEQIELGCFDFKCCEPIYRFRPYFQANVEDVQVTILRQVGLKTEEYQLTDDQFAVTNIHGFTEILVDIRDWAVRCGCENPCELLVIRFDYMAGYETLPDCLFPDICEVVKVISASLSGCGSIEECCQITQPQLGSRLKSKRVGELSWAWDKDTDSAEYVFNQLVITNRFKALGLISLCGTSPDLPQVWAVHADKVTNRRIKHKERVRFCMDEDCDED